MYILEVKTRQTGWSYFIEESRDSLRLSKDPELAKEYDTANEEQLPEYFRNKPHRGIEIRRGK